MSEYPVQRGADGGSGGGSNAAHTVVTAAYSTVPLDQETEPAPLRQIERPAPRAGEQIGPVRLVREIGRGAMGVVFLGHHKLLDRTVAVKFVSVSGGGSEGHSRFFEEAKAAAAVRHAHLTEIYHADVAGDTPYLVLEYVDGPTLSQLLHHAGKLPLRMALSIVSEIAEAVGELHDQGIVHRDLKPSNVMLDHTGRVRVTDFGLAVRRDPAAGGGATETEAPAGTPAYMAPEMFDGRVSPRSDIYALGVVMFQVLTGKVPFEGTFEELRQKHQGAALPVERLKEAGVPDSVVEIIERATHKQLMFRYKTAHELGRAIVALGGDVSEIAKAKGELRAMILAVRKGEAPGVATQGSSGQGSSTRAMPDSQGAPSTNATYADTIARAAEAKRSRMKTLLGSDVVATGSSRPAGDPPPVMFQEAPFVPDGGAGVKGNLWAAYQTPPPAPLEQASQPVGAITTACVIAIVVGGAGILWSVIQGVMGTQPPARSALTPLPPGVRAWQIFELLSSVVLSVLLVVGAVATLGLKAWGRRLLVRAAAAGLVYQVLATVLAAIWVVPAVRRAMVGFGASGPFVSAGGWLHITSIALLVLKGLFVSAAMAAVWVLLTRGKVKEAFEPVPSPASV